MKRYGLVIIFYAILLTALFSPAYPAGEIHVAYLYKLSDFSGTAPYSDVQLSIDRKHDEVYVIAGNVVRVFNGSGMEVYRFGDDPSLGRIRDLAVDERGDLILLSYEPSAEADSLKPKYLLIRCNFRGEPRGRITVKDLPPDYSSLWPQLLFIRDDGILLVSRAQMMAVETDRNGAFRKGYDLAALIGVEEEDRPNTEIFGFSVDGKGNMLFTVPVLFQAYKISPEGAVSSFGKKGSSPGTFGVVNGIAASDDGNYLVSDSLRSVVMVFDEKFRFLTEFGSYGSKPQNLVRPRELALGNSGKVYVTQMRNRGVSVFSVAPN